MADLEQRLDLYRQLLDRLTGATPPTPEPRDDATEQDVAVAGVDEAFEEFETADEMDEMDEMDASPEVAAAALAPEDRKLQILRSMLAQLQG